MQEGVNEITLTKTNRISVIINIIQTQTKVENVLLTNQMHFVLYTHCWSI
jgi:hypothetical protein